ncbi:flavodoxin family protein [Lacticigenium naphthae]|uniref:flavodoxin family protein n=1 Tax=Lacticigenium naphthae TaxID=515351 RepID=UPI0004080830|nr:NAD(P)H-dependent oxidoreductase [Lacticigenium naphthae]
MKNTVVNASKNKQGTTTRLAAQILKDLDHQTIHLIDHHVDQLGQRSEQDEFFKIMKKVDHPDILVIGTPVYWSGMTGYLKTFIDRLTDTMDEHLDSTEAPFNGTKLVLIVQGTAPQDAIPGIETVIKHICQRFFMDYQGLVTTPIEAWKMNEKLSK